MTNNFASVGAPSPNAGQVPTRIAYPTLEPRVDHGTWDYDRDARAVRYAAQPSVANYTAAPSAPPWNPPAPPPPFTLKAQKKQEQALKKQQKVQGETASNAQTVRSRRCKAELKHLQEAHVDTLDAMKILPRRMFENWVVQINVKESTLLLTRKGFRCLDPASDCKLEVPHKHHFSRVTDDEKFARQVRADIANLKKENNAQKRVFRLTSRSDLDITRG